MASKRVQELEKLRKKLFGVGVAAMRAEEYTLAAELQQLMQKLNQKIDGHKAHEKQRRKK